MECLEAVLKPGLLLTCHKKCVVSICHVHVVTVTSKLVVAVVTQTLGKVQIGGVSRKRAASGRRIKSYIHSRVIFLTIC